MTKLLLLIFAMTSTFHLSAQQTPKPDSLKEYTGKYKFPEGSEVTEIRMVVENGVLWAQSVKGNSELKRIAKDTFEVVTYTGIAAFKRDEKGLVNSLHIHVGDLIMEGTKSEEIQVNPAKKERLSARFPALKAKPWWTCERHAKPLCGDCRSLLVCLHLPFGSAQ